MIILPSLPGSTESRAPQLINPNVAAAPGHAIAGVGREVAAAGQVGGEVARQIQGAENDRHLSEVGRELSKRQAAFSSSLLEDHDYQGYAQKAEDLISEAQGLITPEMSPVVRERLGITLGDWAGDFRIKTNEAAQLKSVSAAKNELALAQDQFGETNDLAGYKRHLNGQSYLSPSEKKVMLAEAEREFESRQVEREIILDPEGWLKKNKDKAPGNLAQHRARIRLARNQVLDNTREAYDSAEDLIAEGKLTTDEEVDKLYPDLRPAVRELLKDEVAKAQDAGLRKIMQSREYQETTAGEVSRMMAEYDPGAENFDEDFVAIRQRIGNLLPGPLKDEFEKQVKTLRSDYETEGDQAIKTKSDWAFLQLDEHFEEAGTKAPGQVLGAYLDDGLLKDPELLEQFGFSKKVALTIAGLGKKHQKEALEMLRDEWNSSNARAADFPAHLGAALDAIWQYKGPSHEVVTPDNQAARAAAKTQQTRKMGRAKLELADWLRLNPEADMEKISGRLKEMEIRVEAGKSNVGNFSPAPRRKVKGTKGTGVEKISAISLPKKLAMHEDTFIKYGKKYGVDPRFLAAISQLETDNGTSSAYRNKKNAMGVSNSKRPIAFASVDQSIERMARVLGSSKGPYRNAGTLQEIGNIYAPPGAVNDVNGTNESWPRGVARYLQQLGVPSPYTTTLVER